MQGSGRVGWPKVVAASFFAVALSACVKTQPAISKAPAPPDTDTELAAAPEENEARIEVKIPALPKNAGCKQAQNAYSDAWAIEGKQRADLTRGQFGAVFARNSYFAPCKVPSRFEISICAAVQNGEVLGATVRTSPRAPRYERCIEQGVRRLRFPASPRMDVTKTVFEKAS